MNGLFFWSGREDLNLRPLAPHASALAGLRHAPLSAVASLFHLRNRAIGTALTCWSHLHNRATGGYCSSTFLACPEETARFLGCKRSAVLVLSPRLQSAGAARHVRTWRCCCSLLPLLGNADRCCPIRHVTLQGPFLALWVIRSAPPTRSVPPRLILTRLRAFWRAVVTPFLGL